MKLLGKISNHIGTVWYLQTKKKNELFVVNVIFMKCAVFNFFFLLMFSTLFFFNFGLPMACHFCSVFNLYSV